MSAWGCPYEQRGVCNRLGGLDCDPGRKGCILHGRFRFSNEAKNRSRPAGTAEEEPKGEGSGDEVAVRG